MSLLKYVKLFESDMHSQNVPFQGNILFVIDSHSECFWCKSIGRDISNHATYFPCSGCMLTVSEGLRDKI